MRTLILTGFLAFGVIGLAGCSSSSSTDPNNGKNAVPPQNSNTSGKITKTARVPKPPKS
jgi:hypothetical protein